MVDNLCNMPNNLPIVDVFLAGVPKLLRLLSVLYRPCLRDDHYLSITLMDANLGIDNLGVVFLPRCLKPALPVRPVFVAYELNRRPLPTAPAS